MTERVHCDEGARFKVRFGSSNCADDYIPDGRRQNVLGANLNNAGTGRPQRRQQHAEIEIVGENDPAFSRGEIEDSESTAPGWPIC